VTKGKDQRKNKKEENSKECSKPRDFRNNKVPIQHYCRYLNVVLMEASSSLSLSNLVLKLKSTHMNGIEVLSKFDACSQHTHTHTHTHTLAVANVHNFNYHRFNGLQKF
jgi:hypothetical protein